MTDTPDLLEIRGLSKTFSQPRGLGDAMLGQPARALQAVRDVSFRLAPGETLGVVGESGCGKSTLGRCIAGLHAPSRGEIFWQGRPLASLGGRQARSRHIQMIFQDPYASLNPRMTVRQTLEEVLRVHGLGDGAERHGRVEELLATVGLAARLKDRLPHALSGGPAPAGQHRPRAGGPAAADHRRRAGLRAGCLDPGADHQSVRGATRAARHRLHLHRP